MSGRVLFIWVFPAGMFYFLGHVLAKAVFH